MCLLNLVTRMKVSIFHKQKNQHLKLAVPQAECQQEPHPHTHPKLLFISFSHEKTLKPLLMKMNSLFPLCFMGICCTKYNGYNPHTPYSSVRYGMENWQRNSPEL